MVKIGREEKMAHSDLRRQQILDAACTCVRAAGFHGASMAKIATKSGLSVGQIYRYFENKNAIMAAVVDHNVARLGETFAQCREQAGSSPEALTMLLTDVLERSFNRDHTALVLEMLAEGARSPNIAAILRSSDARERRSSDAVWQLEHQTHWSQQEFQARVEVLRIVFNGLLVRGRLNPNTDRAALIRVLEPAIRALIT